MATEGHVRINDLRRPVLTDAARRAIEHAERDPVALTVDAVVDAARKSTGLDDFGSEDFLERLSQWIEMFEEDTNRTALSRSGLFASCVRFARTRLLLHELLRRRPEIHDIQIRRPIIIVGLPRSGTTHLQGLLAADARLRSLSLWEAMEPIPALNADTKLQSARSRIVKYESWRRHNDSLLPLAATMDPNNPNDVAEDLLLQLPDFPSGVWELGAPIPRWLHQYLANDQSPHYEYMKTMLKALQWYRGPDRWVLKSPDHCEQLRPLLRCFPDATIVMTHRDPVAVVQSVATMKSYAARLHYHEVDVDAVAASWMDRIESMTRALVRDRHLVPKGNLIDILFHEFIDDEFGTVNNVYTSAGVAVTRGLRNQIQRFLAEHPRLRYGRIGYDLRTDFGIDPAKLRARFEHYQEHFPVNVEVR